MLVGKWFKGFEGVKGKAVFMTDPNIVRYMDEHCVRTGDFRVTDIREYGEYTVSFPVYNASAEFAKNANVVLHLDFTREGNNIVLRDVPKHLLSNDDESVIKRAIADFLYEKEAPSRMLREALLQRQLHPYDKQNDYFAWRKPDDTLFMVGMESDSVNCILIYEYTVK